MKHVESQENAKDYAGIINDKNHQLLSWTQLTASRLAPAGQSAREHVVDEPRGQFQQELAAQRLQDPLDAHPVFDDTIQHQIPDFVVVIIPAQRHGEFTGCGSSVFCSPQPHSGELPRSLRYRRARPRPAQDVRNTKQNRF